MQEKGYMVYEKGTGEVHIVTSKTDVGKVIGVSRETIWRWFRGCSRWESKDWLIVEGYNRIKSKRGFGR